MKSSRQRFAEFREKMRKGLLDPHRFSDGTRKDVPVATGGHHGGRDGGAPGKHEFKHNKKKLLGEYRVMLKGYYGPVAVLLLLALLATLLTPVMPIALRVLLDDVALGKGLRESAMLARFPWIASWMP